MDPERALTHAEAMIRAGAHLLDVGAESTRPGASAVSEDEEWRRLRPVLEKFAGRVSVPVSVDTRHGRVARWALELGTEAINDVSCGREPEVFRAVAEFQAGYVLMHSRGEPSDMMALSVYRDVAGEVQAELREAINRLRRAGISDAHVVVDPGFGFAKTPEQNWHLLQDLNRIGDLGFPLMVGLSRKRMLRDLVGEGPEALQIAGAVAALFAAQRGARLFRVHDVAATKAALLCLQKIEFPID